jgi:hypothetical protein
MLAIQIQIINSDDDFYEVDKILVVMEVEDNIEYFIKWLDLPIDQCTWENQKRCYEIILIN